MLMVLFKSLSKQKKLKKQDIALLLEAMTSFLITQKFHNSLNLANKQRSDGYPMISISIADDIL